MSKPIVVGVDGSETAAAAARTAAKLAEALQVELVVVSAYGYMETQRVSAEGQQISLHHGERAREAAEAAVSSLREDHPTLTMTPQAHEGKPGNALVDVATRAEAGIIVVGNRRVQSLARVLGTVASDVARKAPCDVYVAHTHG